MSFLEDLARRLYCLLFAPSRLAPPAELYGPSSVFRRSFKRLSRLLALHLLWVGPLTAAAVAGICVSYDTYDQLDWAEVYGRAGEWMVLSLLTGLVQRQPALAVCCVSSLAAILAALSAAAPTLDEKFSVIVVVMALFYAVVMGRQSYTYLSLLMGLCFSLQAGLYFSWESALWIFFAFTAIAYRLPVYAVEVVWAAHCETQLRTRRAMAPAVWRRYPLAWDETIALPLPRAREFLTELFRFDSSFGLDCVEFVVLQRPVHAAAARGALADFTVCCLEVRGWEDIASLPRRLEWLRENFADSPAGLTEYLPRFLKISEFARQVLALHGTAQKINSLTEAIRAVDALRTALVAAPATIHTGLLSTAKQWHGTLVGAREAFEASGKARQEIPPVFTFGVPLGEDAARLFVGREQIIQNLERLLFMDSRPPAVLLFGARRMGKSSVLHQLPVRAGPNVASCFLDCQNPAYRENVAQFFSALSERLAMGLERRGFTVEPLTAESLQVQPFGVFDSWLRATERKFPISLRVFICFDEYESLNKTIAAGWGEELLEYLRHLQQHRPRFLIIFSGVRPFHELGPLWSRHFVSARLTRLTFIPAADLEPLLRSPCDNFNMRYEPGVVEEVLRLTAGQPFLTQALALELVEVLNLQGRQLATRRDLEHAHDKLFESGKEYFKDLWLDAGADGRKHLLALARGQSPSVLASTVDHLVSMDVIDAAGKFTVPLVAEWVAKPEQERMPQIGQNQAG